MNTDDRMWLYEKEKNDRLTDMIYDIAGYIIPMDQYSPDVDEMCEMIVEWFERHMDADDLDRVSLEKPDYEWRMFQRNYILKYRRK